MAKQFVFEPEWFLFFTRNSRNERWNKVIDAFRGRKGIEKHRVKKS